MSTQKEMYERALDITLLTLDISKVREMEQLFPNYHPTGFYKLNDETMLLMLHKVRTVRPGIPTHLRLESVEWLRAGNWKGFNSMLLPPPGVLPE